MRDEENDSLLARENKILKAELAVAKEKIKQLEQQLEASKFIPLDQTELAILAKIADSDMDDAFEMTFSEFLHLSKPRLDYHLHRLTHAGCVDVRFIDPEWGENFEITQRGREVLARNNLL